MPRTESNRAICPMQRDRGDESGQKFFETLISEIAARRAGARRRGGAVIEHIRARKPFPIDFRKRPCAPPKLPKGTARVPSNDRAPQQRNGFRQYPSKSGLRRGERDSGTPAPGSSRREIRRACQMTSAGSSARTVFSASAAHHPSAAWLRARRALRTRNVVAQTAAAVRALSRDRRMASWWRARSWIAHLHPAAGWP